jgi:hypothetical protein
MDLNTEPQVVESAESPLDGIKSFFDNPDNFVPNEVEPNETELDNKDEVVDDKAEVNTETTTKEDTTNETTTKYELEDEIEDRLAVPATTKEEKLEEKQEEKKEVVLETKKTKIPFKNDIQKVLYNFLSENETGIKEVSSILNKEYESLDPVALIELDIRSSLPQASEKFIQKKLSAKLTEIESSYDLEDPSDIALHKEELALEAASVKAKMEAKRAEIIEKYSSDVDIEFQQEQEVQKTDEELMAEKESLILKAQQDFMDNLKESKVSIQDKDGPIFIPIDDMKAIAESVVDPIGFITKLFLDEKGVFNFEAYAKWANYAINPNIHDNTLLKKGIAIGRKQIASGMKNPSVVAARNTGSGSLEINQNTGLPTDLNSFVTAIGNK